METETLGRRTAYTFCHDYQNAGCHRPNCKFLHCSREEEDYYKQTGQLPVRLQQAAALGIGVLPNKLPILKGEVPICKDYLRGECKRSTRCKYRHMHTASENDINSQPIEQEKPEKYTTTPEYEQYETFEEQQEVPSVVPQTSHTVLPAPTLINSPPLKRRRPDFLDTPMAITAGTNGLQTSSHTGYEWVNSSLRTPAEYCLLEEENMMLRRKVDELKKQASDLAATNEVLLEQNARFRSSHNSTVVPPIVTVSQVVTPTITAAAAIARTAALPQAQVPLPTSIHAPRPHLTATGNGHVLMSMSHQQELIMSMSQQAVVPKMAPELMSAATPLNPPTLNPPTLNQAPPLNPGPTQPGTAMLHRSVQGQGSKVELGAALGTAAPPPLIPVSLNMSVASMMPASSMLPAVTAGVTMSGTNFLAGQQASMSPMNGTSRPLVSYPVMSHNHTQLPRSSMPLPISSLAMANNSPNISSMTLSASTMCPPIPNNTMTMPNVAMAIPSSLG